MNNKKLEEVVFLVFIEILILFIFRAFLPQSDSDFYFYAKTGLYIFDILFVIFMVKVIDHENMSFIGVAFQNMYSQLINGIVTFIVLLILYVLPYYLIFRLNNTHPLTDKLLLHIFINIFIIAMAEEMLFRGLIFERLRQLMGSDAKAIFIGSFIFGISQYPLTHDTGMLLMYAYLGIILSIIKVKFNVRIFSLALAHGLVLSVFSSLIYVV